MPLGGQWGPSPLHPLLSLQPWGEQLGGTTCCAWLWCLSISPQVKGSAGQRLEHPNREPVVLTVSWLALIFVRGIESWLVSFPCLLSLLTSQPSNHWLSPLSLWIICASWIYINGTVLLKISFSMNWGCIIFHIGPGSFPESINTCWVFKGGIYRTSGTAPPGPHCPWCFSLVFILGFCWALSISSPVLKPGNWVAATGWHFLSHLIGVLAVHYLRYWNTQWSLSWDPLQCGLKKVTREPKGVVNTFLTPPSTFSFFYSGFPVSTIRYSQLRKCSFW